MHKQLADNGMHYAKFKINNREEHQSLEIQALYLRTAFLPGNFELKLDSQYKVLQPSCEKC